MVVYTESNFVLEVAREQEQVEAARKMLELAQLNQIQLALPIFALIEPFWTIEKHERTRENVYRSLEQQSGQFQRSKTQNNLATSIRDLLAEMRTIRSKETNNLESLAALLLQIAQPVEVTKQVLEKAFEYRNRFQLGIQDAVMFAAIMADLAQRKLEEAKCFISRDIEAFGRKNPYEREIKAELASFNCQLKLDFEAALSFIQSNFNQPQL